jgi:hypothetical protein
MVVALSANAASQTRRGVSHGEADGKDRGDGQAPIREMRLATFGGTP